MYHKKKSGSMINSRKSTIELSNIVNRFYDKILTTAQGFPRYKYLKFRHASPHHTCFIVAV